SALESHSPPNLDVNSLDIPRWRDLNGVMSNFSVSRAWEAFRPRGNKVHWFRIVWFPHSIPHHSFHLWLTKRSLKELRDVITVTVRLKLLSFRFKNSVNVSSLLDRWKMPSLFRLYGN
ncbi:reverse transcriptase zinc-binding domain-containing protein, partial [Tanacetum coccineum]